METHEQTECVVARPTKTSKMMKEIEIAPNETDKTRGIIEHNCDE